jgi:hypothetical protein
MKISQHTDNKGRGRPKLSSEEKLLRYEAHWVETFRALRDGVPEIEGKIRSTSGTLMKVSGQEKLLILNEQDRETLSIMLPGQVLRTVRQSKFTSTPEDIQNWRNQVQMEEEKFKRVTLGHEIITTKISAIPAERELWEALKRARTAPQVRRICSRSKIWLKPRWEFPDGSHIEWWPYRRALYKYAEEFCQAKLDTRYPGRDARESGDYRRIEYFARAMAGLSLGFAASTAIERLRKMKHSRMCRCWRCTLKIAPRYRPSLARFLAGKQTAS